MNNKQIMVYPWNGTLEYCWAIFKKELSTETDNNVDGCQMH